MTQSPWYLIGLAVTAIGLLVILVTWAKINAFIALLLAALFVGAGVPRPPMLSIAQAFGEGMGATLGGIAGVVCLGTILGKLVAESRGAEVLARRFVAIFGPRQIGWCVMSISLVVGLTTWFAVGLILLAPILHTLTRETKRPFLLLALPMLACLSVMHGLMPPHPGPVMAINAFHANTGGVLLWGFVLGLPTAALAGPFFARIANRRLQSQVQATAAAPPALHPGTRWPDFGLTLTTMLLPVALMLLKTVVDLAVNGGEGRQMVDFIGDPTIALLVGVLFAHWSLGARCGFPAVRLLKFSEEAIASIGTTILVIGAGGGFARVLTVTRVADAMGQVAGEAHLSPLLYAWMVSAFIRVATGSATVAITASSALLAPVLLQHPETNRQLAVIAVGCGSLFLSHLNDGGFWIVKECLDLSVAQTFRTWTVLETIIGLAGLGLTLLAAALI